LDQKRLRMRSGEDFPMRKFIVCTVHLIYQNIKYRRLRGAGHVTRKEEDKSPFTIFNM
jgi:hypothetical protein